jgi:hypothetical protein
VAATPSQWVLFYTCGGGVARDFCGAGGGTGVGWVVGEGIADSSCLASLGRRNDKGGIEFSFAQGDGAECDG